MLYLYIKKTNHTTMELTKNVVQNKISTYFFTSYFSYVFIYYQHGFTFLWNVILKFIKFKISTFLLIENDDPVLYFGSNKTNRNNGRVAMENNEIIRENFSKLGIRIIF